MSVNSEKEYMVAPQLIKKEFKSRNVNVHRRIRNMNKSSDIAGAEQKAVSREVSYILHNTG